MKPEQAISHVSVFAHSNRHVVIGVGLVAETQCTLTLTAHVYHGGRECESGYLRANIYIKVMEYCVGMQFISHI